MRKIDVLTAGTKRRWPQRKNTNPFLATVYSTLAPATGCGVLCDSARDFSRRPF